MARQGLAMLRERTCVSSEAEYLLGLWRDIKGIPTISHRKQILKMFWKEVMFNSVEESYRNLNTSQWKSLVYGSGKEAKDGSQED